jgi:SAM-dependent methyltransferase
VVQPDFATDTADRSLAHWSEEGRREMEAFYALAQLDYRLLTEAVDWSGLLDQRGSEAARPLSLLDVACGSGKFPRALLTGAGLDPHAVIDYDLLDPSAFSLREAAAELALPFRERSRLETTLEDLSAGAGPWDVVWATHALYALQPANLPAAVERFRAAVAPGGFAFLAQGAADGHYLRVYAAFLEGARGGEGTQYVSSDDLIAELVAQGSVPEVRRLAYDHVVAETDTAVLEGYLQRCLFDDTISLAEMLDAPVLGPYLASCHDAGDGVYRFHQEVDCVVLTSTPEAFPWTAAS